MSEPKRTFANINAIFEEMADTILKTNPLLKEIDTRNLYYFYDSGQQMLKFYPDGSVDLVKAEDVYKSNSELNKEGF